KPMSDPTDRSIPPATITGVKASASKPISTLSRAISKALTAVKKFFPMAAKSAISPTSRNERTSSCDRDQPRVAACSAARKLRFGMPPPRPIECVSRDGHQNDRPLNRFFPVRLCAEIDEGRADRDEQDHTDQRPD